MMHIFSAAASAAVDYGTIFGGATDEATTAISATMPLAIKIMGILLGIGIGYKVIKRFAK